MAAPVVINPASAHAIVSPFLANRRYVPVIYTDGTLQQVGYVEWPVDSTLTLDGSSIVQVLPTDSTGQGLPMTAMPQAKRRLDVHAFEISLCSIARRSGSFTVATFEDLTSDTAIRIWQSALPGTSKGIRTDEMEMDQISVVAHPITANSMQCHWVATGPVIGNFKFYYQIRTA